MGAGHSLGLPGQILGQFGQANLERRPGQVTEHEGLVESRPG